MNDRTNELDLRSPTSALERSRSSSTAMAVMARRLRFATSRRSPIYKAVGLRPRFIDRVFAILVIVCVLVGFVVPNLASIVYFGFIASDQFEAETRFTVRSSAPITKEDKLGDVSGLPSAEIVQNSLIVTNFVTSPALLDILEQDGNFIVRYQRSGVDFLSRLDDDSSREDRLDYWKDMVTTSINPSSGIITIDVRAFTPQDAHDLLTVIVAQSEKLINDLNDRIWADVNATARRQVARARSGLTAVRGDLQEAQNKAGMLTIESSSDALSQLLVQVQAEQIDLESRYNANLAVVDKSAPQMKVLARQIASKKDQIADLKTKVASEKPDTGGTLADTSLKFSELTFERSVAEEQLKASIGASETLQFVSQQQLMYVDPFLSPTTPGSAEYPRRFLWIGLTFLGSLIATAALFGMLTILRKRFD